MQQLSESFVDLPAWGFWGLVVGLIAIVSGIWAAFRAGEGKTRIYYELVGTARLLGSHAQVSGLEVTRQGQRLEDPYVTTLRLEVRSRHDITEDQFSKQRPLVFDLGVPILDILGNFSRPEDRPVPEYTAAASTLCLGPDLLDKHAQLRFTFLLEGKPDLKPSTRTLGNVEVIRGAASKADALSRILAKSPTFQAIIGEISLVLVFILAVLNR